MPWHVETPGHFYDADEGSVVYYDPRSGDTHLISAFAAAIVRELIAGQRSLEELTACLSPMMEDGPTDDLSDAVSTALTELSALDIVQRD